MHDTPKNPIRHDPVYTRHTVERGAWRVKCSCGWDMIGDRKAVLERFESHQTEWELADPHEEP